MGNSNTSTKILLFIVIGSTVSKYVAAGTSGMGGIFGMYTSGAKNVACDGEKQNGKVIAQFFADCQFPKSASNLEDLGCHIPCLLRKLGWISDDYEGLDSTEEIIQAEKTAGTDVNPEKIRKPFAKELMKRKCHKKLPPKDFLKTVLEDKRDCKKIVSAGACYLAVAAKVSKHVAAGTSGLGDIFRTYLSGTKNILCNGEKQNRKVIAQILADCQLTKSTINTEDLVCHVPCLLRKFGWISDDYEGLDSMEKIIQGEKRGGTGVNPEKIQKTFAKELMKRSCHKKLPPKDFLKTALEDKRDCKKIFSAGACYLGVATEVCKY